MTSLGKCDLHLAPFWLQFGYGLTKMVLSGQTILRQSDRGMHDYMCGMHSSCGEPCDMQHSGRGAYGAPRPWAGGRAQQHAELQSHGPWALIWRRTNRHETAYGADTCVNILWQHTELTSLQFGWPRLATCGVAITRPSVPHTERTNRHDTAYRADACANILMKARLHV